MNSFDLLAQFGAESVQFVSDEARGLHAIIAVHSTRRGPAFGGIRTLSYSGVNAALTDALRLAQHMSYKAALADLKAGGGKIVVMKTDRLDRNLAFIALGRAIDRLGGSFFTGLDVGTTYEDLENVAKGTAQVASHLDFGRATARGCMAALKAAFEHLGQPGLRGKTVAVQGLGSVGRELARMLAQAQARVLVADIQEEAAQSAAREIGAEVVKPGGILSVSCDALAPCALGGILTPSAVKSLRCQVVAGSANNQLASPAAGKALQARGIVYVPDFVANAGALIKGVLEHQAGKELGFDVVDRVGESTQAVLDRAKAEGRPPAEVAERIALERLA
ncbi:MAG: Glu/Leu/Phe/Val dehydrogenase [Planctomycetaceae bacterium]|nr:Glu/Leu/Phe/Val dehydrogenase [Planctomycetaceae bacterium]HRJ77555.1 Glu/Leu/Phe/Val dehydrogenase dimerization domain-containing protein [Planctomycetota bacterium]